VVENESPTELQSYGMAALIRFTLLGLYLALVLPLPVLAPPALRPLLLAAVPLGLVAVLAITSERVEVDGSGIRVGHPAWCAWLLRRGWQLDWSVVTALTPVGTSQGGKVFYVRDRAGGAFLLPQRVERFGDFLERFGACSGLDLTAVGRISPPWTYQLLAILCALMLGGEILTLALGLPGT
jgi:hypothetical protein